MRPPSHLSIERAQRSRDLTALLERIDEAATNAKLERYDGYQSALHRPGTFASEFAGLEATLVILRRRAQSLVERLDKDLASPVATAEYTQVVAALGHVESLTVAAVMFRHAHLDLDRSFFDGVEWPADATAEHTLYSRHREYTFCDLNGRFVGLERAFWSLPPGGDEANPRAHDGIAGRVAALRNDCLAFLEAAPSPGLVTELRRHLDCAGEIVRETPYFQHHQLRTWLADASDALQAWDAAMLQPFVFETVRSAYARLESLQAYPETAALAHAGSFADDPRRVVEAWRDTIDVPRLSSQIQYLYGEAAGGEKWVTAAFIHSLALAAQRCEVDTGAAVADGSPVRTSRTNRARAASSAGRDATR